MVIVLFHQYLVCHVRLFKCLFQCLALSFFKLACSEVAFLDLQVRGRESLSHPLMHTIKRMVETVLLWPCLNADSGLELFSFLVPFKFI